nr:NEDD8-activating enzyme E1 regulatory subunit AXR1-like [Tanacetum cinerariifolium]
WNSFDTPEFGFFKILLHIVYYMCYIMLIGCLQLKGRATTACLVFLLFSQVRIWGEQGQVALEKASICLLNSGPTDFKTLKNLVLGGIGSITVVDDSKVENGDLGNNFKSKFIEEHPVTLIETNLSFFSQFTLVVATQKRCCAMLFHSIPQYYIKVPDSMVKLDHICRDANVMLIFARSYGLSGFVRISEYAVIESKPDHFLDLRLNNPWHELKTSTENIDLDTSNPVAHKHTSYILILVKMAQEWTRVFG